MHQHKAIPILPDATCETCSNIMPCVLSQLLEITKEDWLNGYEQREPTDEEEN